MDYLRERNDARWLRTANASKVSPPSTRKVEKSKPELPAPPGEGRKKTVAWSTTGVSEVCGALGTGGGGTAVVGAGGVRVGEGVAVGGGAGGGVC